MGEQWQDRQGLFFDYKATPCCLYIILEHRVRLLNVWSGRFQHLPTGGQSSKAAAKTIYVVGEPGSSRGAVGNDDLAERIMAQDLDGAQSEDGSKSVAVSKEYDRIQHEKAELIRRVQDLTLRESTLEAQVASVPELYAELASRWRAEKAATSSGSLESSPAKNPVASLWRTMEDTHSPAKGRQREERPGRGPEKTGKPFDRRCGCGLEPGTYVCRQQGPNCMRTFERCPRARGERFEFFMWLMPTPTTSAAGRPSGGSSSSAGINVEGHDGVVYEPAVPEERRKDHEKERLRLAMHERQKDAKRVFKPGTCS